MENILYLIVVFVGFTIPLISMLFFNKKYKVLSFESLIYSYIIFLIAFVFFSKLIHLFIDFDLNSINYLFSNDILLKLRFIFSGYSFIGGYIGILLIFPLLSKLFKIKKKELMLIYIPNILLIYSILKIGCYIKGCCYGITSLPIQLVETILNLSAFIFVLCLLFRNKNKNIILGTSFILFGVLRFIISMFRTFVSLYTLVFIELFCLFLIILGLKIISYNFKEDKGGTYE